MDPKLHSHPFLSTAVPGSFFRHWLYCRAVTEMTFEARVKKKEVQPLPMVVDNVREMVVGGRKEKFPQCSLPPPPELRLSLSHC
jgi:ATP sulfurylase